MRQRRALVPALAAILAGALLPVAPAAAAAPDAQDDTATIIEDVTTSVDVLANDTDADLDVLTVSAVTQGAKGAVTIAGDGSHVTYDPAAHAVGADTFTYTASDGLGGTSIASVNVTITAVNDPPSFVSGGAVTVAEDSGAAAIAGWATAVHAGPADEDATQVVSFQVAATNTALFSVQPAIADVPNPGAGATATLTFTPAANAFGSTSVSVTAVDDGGTANGGDATGSLVTFTPPEHHRPARPGRHPRHREHL
jgi:hypothetical protein